MLRVKDFNGVNTELFLKKTTKVACLLAKDRRPTGYSEINDCLVVMIPSHSNEYGLLGYEV